MEKDGEVGSSGVWELRSWYRRHWHGDLQAVDIVCRCAVLCRTAHFMLPHVMILIDVSWS